VNDAPNRGLFRGGLIFLVFVLIGTLIGAAIAGFAVSSIFSVLIDPQRVRDGSFLFLVVVLFLIFAALPLVASGLIVVSKYMRCGFFRARYAMLTAFLSSGSAGLVYQYFYGADNAGGQELVKAVLLSYLFIGPVAAFCAFVGQRAVRASRLMEAPALHRDAEMSG
jgi:hypothetical protein